MDINDEVTNLLVLGNKLQRRLDVAKTTRRVYFRWINRATTEAPYALAEARCAKAQRFLGALKRADRRVNVALAELVKARDEAELKAAIIEARKGNIRLS